MKELKFQFITAKDIYNFVSLTSSSICNVTLKSRNDYKVNGKSLMGIFALNLFSPVNIIIEHKLESEVDTLYNKIKEKFPKSIRG